MANLTESLEVDAIFERDVVLIFHCVPHTIAPELEIFWMELRKQLIEEGYDILLVSTTEISNEKIPYIKVPYLVPDYVADIDRSYSKEPSAAIISLIKSWYKISHDEAVGAWQKIDYFYLNLLGKLEPALVISWQSTNPVSRVVKQSCLTLGIPWRVAERGWVKNTLMIDSAENNGMSEINSSFALQEIYKKYKTNQSIVGYYKERALSSGVIERYPISDELNSINRPRWGIPIKSKIYALFTHGEPHITTVDGYENLQRNHGLDSKKLENI